MTYKIDKEYTFSAAHHLYGLPDDHQCARNHGHNYRVVVSLSGETLDDTGFLIDYHDLDPVKSWIDKELDHQDLNDILAISPTAELLAHMMQEKVLELIPKITARGLSVSIGVSETMKTWAWSF